MQERMEGDLPPGADAAEDVPPPPMAQAIVSSNWKHRKFGYEELEKLMLAAEPTDGIFAEYREQTE